MDNNALSKDDIKLRYEYLCRKEEEWRKKIKGEFSYEDGYHKALVFAIKQFRNLFEETN